MKAFFKKEVRVERNISTYKTGLSSIPYIGINRRIIVIHLLGIPIYKKIENNSDSNQ